MRKTKWSLWLFLGLALTIQAGSSARASQSTLSKKELKALIANARTPQDHERLAAYYRDREQHAKANQTKHEEMLYRYRDNPLSHPFIKSQSPDDHCRTMIRLFGQEAGKNAALAERQEKIAGDLRRQK